METLLDKVEEVLAKYTGEVSKRGAYEGRGEKLPKALPGFSCGKLPGRNRIEGKKRKKRRNARKKDESRGDEGDFSRCAEGS